MLSIELFIHLSFITLYNDSEMKGKTRLRKEGEIEERGLVVFAWLASAECRCLPRAKGASSSPLGFLFACGAEEGCGLSPRPIAEVTLTSNPILNSGIKLFEIWLHTGRFCGFFLWFKMQRGGGGGWEGERWGRGFITSTEEPLWLVGSSLLAGLFQKRLDLNPGFFPIVWWGVKTAPFFSYLHKCVSNYEVREIQRLDVLHKIPQSNPRFRYPSPCPPGSPLMHCAEEIFSLGAVVF